MAWTTAHQWSPRPSWAAWTTPRRVGLAFAVALHVIGLSVLCFTEYGWFGQITALLAWMLFNGLWLMLLRRPASAAALSLAMLAVLIVLSHFKYSILQLTLTFL